MMKMSPNDPAEDAFSSTDSPVAVCVPARDEAETLPELIQALNMQTNVGSAGLLLCLYLDGDGDGKMRAVAAASRWPVKVRCGVKRGPANAGRARARAMALGLAAMRCDDALLLTTDADSAPTPDWVDVMRQALARADVVAGRIVRLNGQPSVPLDRVETYLDRLHAFRRRLDPVTWELADTHHQTGGANLGFRAGAYRAIGGFANVPSDEDVGIVFAASRAGYRVARDPRAVVRTSDRRVGRATGGLADALARLDRSENEAEVDHPEDLAWQYRMHALARAAFAKGAPVEIAVPLGLPADAVEAIAQHSRNAEAFVMRIVPTRPGGIRRVPVSEAERLLAAMFEPAAAAVA